MSEVPMNSVNGAEELYKLLRVNTEKSATTARKYLLAHPFEGVTKEEMSALLDAVGTEEVPEVLKDIAFIKGRKDTWYYDGTIMTRHFAELYSMIQEKDLLHTVATVARSDSALYPKPTEFRKLENMPFWFTEDELLGAAARFPLEPGYEDIGVIEASNGEKAFYSKKSLTENYARSLLEWYEVEIHENP